MFEPNAEIELIGQSPAMQELRAKLKVVARARKTTLITGPTGSGKEVAAALLHALACPDHRPHVPVHCGALPEQLVEAELFGHTRGAFTGATAARAGLIKTAEGGTLFLDEVDSLSHATQTKLLRLLETGEYRRVGADTVEHADVWVIAATNSSLEERVRDGSFREDLYYRLDVLRLEIPPLAARGDDVLLLAEHFLAGADCDHHVNFGPGALAALAAHDWPGNVRELKHRVERAALMAPGPTIEARDLGLSEACAAELGKGPSFQGVWQLIERDGLSLPEAMARCERALIEAALRAEDQNRTRAAARLGIHVRTIFKKLAR